MDETRPIKCGSSWPAAPPPRDQTGRSHYFHSQINQEAVSGDNAIIQEPRVYSTLNLTSNRPGYSSLGDSFVPFLSGSKQSLPGEVERSSSLNLPTVMPSGISVLNFGFQSRDPESMSSSAERVVMDLSKFTISKNYPQTSSCAALDSAEAVFNHTLEIPWRQGQLSHLALSNIHNLPKTASHDVSNLMKGCPRVFCLGTGGDLLLSNMEFLGVRCICHGLLMSLAKFCEHSGLFTLNPGEAICMESGESIAEWHRTYMLAFGMRVPDNSSRWDGPNGISACGSLVNSSFMVLPKISKNSDSIHPANSLGGTLKSRQSSNDFTPSIDPLMGQAPISNLICTSEQKNLHVNSSYGRSFSACTDGGYTGFELVNRLKENSGQKNSLVGCRTYKNLGTSDGEDCMLWEMSKHTSGSNQQNFGCYQTVANCDSINKGCQSFIIDQHMKNFKPLGLETSVGGSHTISVEECNLGQNTVTSSIELRLGQPPQPADGLLSQMPFRSEPFDALQYPRKQQIYEPFVQTVAGARVKNDCQQKFSLAPSGSLIFDGAKEIQLNCTHNTGRSTIAMATTKIAKHEGMNPANFAPISAFVRQYPTSDVSTSSQCHANGIVANSEQNVKVRTVENRTYLINRDGQVSFLRSKDEVGGKQSVNGCPFSHHPENSHCSISPAEGLSHVLSFPSVALESKRPGESRQVAGVVGNGKKSSPFDRSMNYPSSSATFVSGLALKPNSIYLSALPSASMNNNKNEANVRKQFVGDNLNLGLLAVRNTNELKDQCALSQMNPEKGHLSSDTKMHLQQRVSPGEPTFSGKLPDISVCVSIPGEGETASQIKGCHNYHYSGDFEKLIGVEGDISCGLSACTQRASLCCHRFGHDAGGHSSSRLQKTEIRKIMNSSLHDSCNVAESCRPVPHNCSCCIQSKYLTGNCIHCQRHMDAATEQTSSMSTSAAVMEKNSFLSLGEKLHMRCSHLEKECPSSQWKDVSARATAAMNGPSGSLDTSQAFRVQISGIAATGGNAVGLLGETLKEQQMSNGCSGSSNPVITEVSIEDNRVSFAFDAGDSGSVQNPLCDEGSGTEKCLSSDDSGRSVKKLRAGSSYVLQNQDRVDIIEEIKPCNSSLRLKEDTKCYSKSNVETFLQPREEGKAGKKKKKIKWKRLDVSAPSENKDALDGSMHCAELPFKTSNSPIKKCFMHSCGSESVKRKRSVLPPKVVSRRRGLCESQDYYHADEGNDYSAEPQDSGFVGAAQLSSGRTIRHLTSCEETAKLGECQTGLAICRKKPRPVVCGNLGIISNGKLSEQFAKPAKIVSLKLILEVAKRRTLIQHIGELKEEYECQSMNNKELIYDKFFISKQEEAHRRCSTNFKELRESSSSSSKASSGKRKGCFGEFSFLKKNLSYENESEDQDKPVSCAYHANTKLKKARKHILCGPTKKGNHLNPAKQLCLEGLDHVLPTDNAYRSYLKSSLCNRNKSNPSSIHSVKGAKCKVYPSELDAFCCVCGNANKDEVNCLLECSSCLIRVHQACYGVSKVPKHRWCCRPCRTKAKNIACVLCGYEGGAMTRALRSRSIVKGLVEAWKVGPSSESGPNGFDASVITLGCGHIFQLEKSESESVVSLHKQEACNVPPLLRNLSINTDSSSFDFLVHNTITAGLLDPTVTQWVHMVCGLWTPGTRCPNVDTMSAFDVSGALRATRNVVCSMCNRPGGSCIKCRVLKCSIQFHPWCAHQKGLLQSEVEGIDNEKVGFYGRCLLHATNRVYHSGSQPVEIHGQLENAREREPTCARAEGYKGRKTGEALRHNLDPVPNDKNGCLVTQAQINAWLHINGQKSFIRGGFIKPVTSDTEYDCRKEYSRYKQAKGWKHLVVYKSGIHALGLYTSKFIARGAMVVEYVGEIVGPRVADKRETEYQSGIKLQYKTACYFFRIDKEHIIDATRKGGIARFVNHSCLPNCVAKIISVRNEKKVVFFAERDINPGEEITYDYHFNHEDEGKKIPCLCNAKNCRRFLN